MSKPRNRTDSFRNGECVRLPDGRIGRVRGTHDSLVKVRVRRQTSNTHEFLMCPQAKLRAASCPKGWMSPDGYRRYLRVTLRKMRERQRRADSSGTWSREKSA
jgi:hypothetical protein